MRTSCRTAALTSLALLALVLVGRSQPVEDDPVARLGRATDAWERELGSVVADETYEQTVVRTLRSGSVRGTGGPPREGRVLVSEFTLIHFDDGPSDWLGFRDVRSVDGRPITAAAPSIGALMADVSLSWTERWRRVRDRSAAFNIGSIGRDVNLPTFGLAALRTANQSRFRYSAPRVVTLDGARVTTVDFAERARPSLVAGRGGRDVSLAGTVWFDAADGRVRRTELQLRDLVPALAEDAQSNSAPDQHLTSRITVDFAPDANVGTRVPTTMRERYDNAWGEVTTGHARYTNYRRFRTAGRIVRPG